MSNILYNDFIVLLIVLTHKYKRDLDFIFEGIIMFRNPPSPFAVPTYILKSLNTIKKLNLIVKINKHYVYLIYLNPERDIWAEIFNSFLNTHDFSKY